MATSLFSERDDAMAKILVKTLLETKQDVPSFLELYSDGLDAGQEVRFDSDSDGGFGEPAEAANSSLENGHDAADGLSAWERESKPSAWPQATEATHEQMNDPRDSASAAAAVGAAW